MQISQIELQACVRSLTNLRQLTAELELSPDTMAALVSLTALTKLHVLGPHPMVSIIAVFCMTTCTILAVV